MVFLGLGWTRDSSLNVLVALHHILGVDQWDYLRVITLIHRRYVVYRPRHLAPIIIHVSVRSTRARGMNVRLVASPTLGEG